MGGEIRNKKSLKLNVLSSQSKNHKKETKVVIEIKGDLQL